MALTKPIRELLQNVKYDFLELPRKKQAAAILTLTLLTYLAASSIARYKGQVTRNKESARQVEKAPITVKVSAIKRGPFEDALSLLGEVKGIAEIDLKFQTAGVIGYIKHREGEFIKKSELIATLNQKEPHLKYRHSEIEYEWQKRLHSLGGISDLAFEGAACEYELARAELEKSIIAAPKDGVIGKWHVEEGEYLTPNETAITFVDTREMLIECAVTERDLPKVALGQKAKVTVDALSGTELDGMVSVVSKLISGSSRTAPVKIQLLSPLKGLSPGMFARAEIVIFKTQDALVVPAAYFHVEGGKYFLWLAKKNAAGECIAQKTPVEISYFTDDELLIKEGAAEGELIITELPFGITQGEKVLMEDLKAPPSPQ